MGRQAVSQEGKAYRILAIGMLATLGRKKLWFLHCHLSTLLRMQNEILVWEHFENPPQEQCASLSPLSCLVISGGKFHGSTIYVPLLSALIDPKYHENTIQHPRTGPGIWQLEFTNSGFLD